MASSKLTPARGRGFHSLPQEILRLVILEIYPPQGGSDRVWSYAGRIARRAWLAASSPISRPWAAEVYPVLYHTIDIRDHWQAVSLLCSIKRRPVLASLVRHVSAFPSDTEPAEPTTRRSWWQLPSLRAYSLKRGRRKYWKIYDELLRLCSAVTSCTTTSFDCSFLARYLQPTDLCICAIEDSVDLDGFTLLRTLTLAGTGLLNPIQFSNCSGPQWHISSLCLQYLTVSGYDMMRLLSNLRPELEDLQCYRLQVTDALGFVPFHDWIMPVHDTLLEFCIDDVYPWPISFQMLSKLNFLLVDVAVISGMRPEEYLPHAVRQVQLNASRHSVMDRSIFFFAEHAWRIIKADRAALPDLQTLAICLGVHNSADLATWALLVFLLKEAAQRRGIDFKFFAVITYRHGGDSFEWRDPQAGHRTSRGNSRLAGLFSRTFRLARKPGGEDTSW